MSFSPGATPFGTFDGDVQFQADADKIVDFVRRKLGDPIMQVELSSSQIYMAFEEATLEYSAMVNTYQAKSVMASILGTPTGSLSGSENRYPSKLLEFQRRQAEAYGEDAGVNGPHALQSGSIDLIPGQQQYDLQSLLSGALSLSGSIQRMRVKEIFHFSPLAAYRFFGTTSAVNFLHNQFSFESFTPETIFYLLPIWEDILRGMQFETSNRVRRSQYSYELHNNVLTLYPAPSDAIKLYFTYWLPFDPYNPSFQDKQLDGVANLSNVPFGTITYSRLNSISKQWIRKFTCALSKEILGHVRAKMNSIPIPNGDLTMDGPELVSEGKAEQDAMREELKALLEEMTYDKVMARETEMSNALNEALKGSPMGIFVG